jgi:hypothetical protein
MAWLARELNWLRSWATRFPWLRLAGCGHRLYGDDCRSPVRRAVRLRRTEDRDCFACFRVTETFPGQPLDGFGVIESSDANLQLFAGLDLFLDLVIESQDVFAHALILPDERQVPDAHQQQDRDEAKEHDQMGQLVPDPEVDIHDVQLNKAEGETEANKSEEQRTGGKAS